MTVAAILIRTALLSMLLAGAAHAESDTAAARPDDPIGALQQQLRQHPDDFQAWFRLGVTQAKARRFHDAITSFGKVIELQPQLAEPHNNLAVIYNELGDYRAAVRELEASLQLKPDYATAHENIGDLYVKLAADAYRKALASDASPALRRRYERLLHIRDAVSAPLPHAAVQAAPADASLPSQAQQIAAERDTAAAAQPVSAAPAETPAVSRSPIEPTAAVAGNSDAAIQAQPAQAADQPAEAPQVARASAVIRSNKAAESGASDAERDAPAGVAAADQAPDQHGGQQADAADVQAALAAVEAWRSAWNRQDLGAYFAAYSPDFDFGTRFDSLAQWRKYKQRVIRKRAFIQVSLENIEAKALPGGVIRLVFLQHFRSDSYNSDDIKELLLRRSPDGWKIIHEVSR